MVYQNNTILRRHVEDPTLERWTDHTVFIKYLVTPPLVNWL